MGGRWAIDLLRIDSEDGLLKAALGVFNNKRVKVHDKLRQDVQTKETKSSTRNALQKIQRAGVREPNG